jgi:hypothetical protein
MENAPVNASRFRASSQLLFAFALLLLLGACGGTQGFLSPSSGSGQVEIGSVVNGTFTSGSLAVSPSTIAPGGTASVTAVLEYSNGSAYTAPTQVNFSSDCALNKEATITSSVTTNASGEAVATYTAGTGCSGTDTLQATAQVNGSTLVAVGTVTISSSTTAVVDAVVPAASSPPRYVRPGTSVRVGFVVRGATGVPEVGRLLTLRVQGGPQTLLRTTLVRSGVGGLAFATLRVPAGGGPLRVLARLVQGSGAGVGSVSGVFHSAASVHDALLSVVPTVLNLGAPQGRASETLLVSGTGENGIPLADGTRIVLRATRGSLPADCVLRDGRCSVLWKENTAEAAGRGYGAVEVTARTASARRPTVARTVFDVAHGRARVRLVRSRSTSRGIEELLSVTAFGGGLLPAGTRLEFRALGGRLLGASSVTVPNVLAAPGTCRNGADPERGCYLVRMDGHNARLEVVSQAPGGTLSERVMGGAPSRRP